MIIRRVLNRLKAARKTNDAQKDAVLAFTAMTVAACFVSGKPLIFTLGMALFWSSIAFLINLIDPM